MRGQWLWSNPATELILCDMSPAPRDGLVGQRIRKDRSLVIVRKLGEGGMSSVYLGWDEKNQRAVAVKFLHDHVSDKPQVLERFRREGESFGRLQHDNLVRVYATGQSQGRLYIVCEYVNGWNLYQVLERDGPLPLRRALFVCRDIAAGLFEAHRNMVVHRDLKPENVMIRKEDGAVKVLDFGIAKNLDADASDLTLTRVGTYIGTPAYSAPEQVRGEAVDHRADIFSLGVILYELLTGKVAFDGRHSTEVLKATLKDAPIPITQVNREVTSPVAAVIDKMIRKRPENRHQTMQEVIEDIEGVLDTVEGDIDVDLEVEVRNSLKTWFED